MKKAVFIFLSIGLFFSNCQQNNPPPTTTSGASSACGALTGTINGAALAYNPDPASCEQNNMFTNNMTLELNFTDFCPPVSSPFPIQYNLFLTYSVFSGSLVAGTYDANMQNNNSTFLGVIQYTIKNCGAGNTMYMNVDAAGYNGTFTITNLDTVNKLVSGSCNVTLSQPKGSGGSPQPLVFSFTNVSYN